jgi:hypothetical protein
MRTAEALVPRERQAGTDRFEHRQRAAEPAVAERRTVVITGRTTYPARRRSPTQAQLARRPDRVALWAFLLGLVLVLMAAATAHGAPL